MSELYVWEASNMFCGDHDPTASMHLVLEEFKFPTLEENFQDHHPGGAPVGIEVATGIKKLEPNFKTKGHQPDVLTQFGLGTPHNQNFTIYSVYRNKRTGAYIERKGILLGRLGKVEEDANKRGEIGGTEYSINEVLRYEYYWDGAEKLYWDFFTNTWRVNGVPQNREVNRILKIPGGY